MWRLILLLGNSAGMLKFKESLLSLLWWPLHLQQKNKLGWISRFSTTQCQGRNGMKRMPPQSAKCKLFHYINSFYKELLQVDIQDWRILAELTTTSKIPYEQKLISLIYWWCEGGWLQNNKPWTIPRRFFWMINMLSLELDEYIYLRLFLLLFWYRTINS